MPGVPTEGTRPDTANLSLAAEPQSAPVPTQTPPGRQVRVGDAAEGVVVDPVTRTVAVAVRNPNSLVLLDADPLDGTSDREHALRLKAFADQVVVTWVAGEAAYLRP